MKSDLINEIADAVAERVLARIASATGAPVAPYTSDPRALHLPPGWSKRAWDDRGRLADSDARRPPLRKAPRGYSCSVAAFESWDAARPRQSRKHAAAETDEQRRDRQLAALGLRRAS